MSGWRGGRRGEQEFVGGAWTARPVPSLNKGEAESVHRAKAVSAPTWSAANRAPDQRDVSRETPAACRASAATRPHRRARTSRSRAAARGRTGRRCSGRSAPYSGAVDRADDEFAAAVEELAGLPVELGRHVHAAVQVGDDAAVEAQRERARRLAEVEDVEQDGAPFLGELRGGAEALRRQRRELGTRRRGRAVVRHSRRASARGRRSSGRRAAADGPAKSSCSCAPKLTATLAQPALAASCRSCVVSPTISVRSVDAPSSRISSTQHQRIGLAARLVGGAGGVEQAVRAASWRAPASRPRRVLPVATASQWLRAFSATQHLERAVEERRSRAWLDR